MDVVIDNCIVSRLMGNGIRIQPIRLAKKMNPELNIDMLPRITYGNRAKDNYVISQLAMGVLKYEDLILHKRIRFD